MRRRGRSGGPAGPELPRSARERPHDSGLCRREDEQVQDSGAGRGPGERGALPLRPDPRPGDLPAQVDGGSLKRSGPPPEGGRDSIIPRDPMDRGDSSRMRTDGLYLR